MLSKDLYKIMLTKKIHNTEIKDFLFIKRTENYKNFPSTSSSELQSKQKNSVFKFTYNYAY